MKYFLAALISVVIALTSCSEKSKETNANNEQNTMSMDHSVHNNMEKVQ